MTSDSSKLGIAQQEEISPDLAAFMEELFREVETIEPSAESKAASEQNDDELASTEYSKNRHTRSGGHLAAVAIVASVVACGFGLALFVH